MLSGLHKNNKLQNLLGLFAGILFGFLLQKGGVTDFNVILAQLVLKDWRIVKLMLTAIIIGSLGVHLLVSLKLATLQPKKGSVGLTIIGGLIFGVGFAILGYCPGIVAGAAGQGALDALTVGFTGILIGSGIFIFLYPSLEPGILKWGAWEKQTLPELFKCNRWIVVIAVDIILAACLWLLEVNGL